MLMRPHIVFGRKTVAGLIARAAELTGIPIASIMTRQCDEDARLTRFAVMLAAKRAGRSNTQIGRALGGLHHTTVMHGVKRGIQIEATDQDFAELVRELAPKAEPAGFAPLLPPHIGCSQPSRGEEYPQLLRDQRLVGAVGSEA